VFTLTTTINYDYDEDEDILYISVGKPAPAITEEKEEGILIRRSIKNNKIIGITILDYKDRIEKNEKINIPKKFNLDKVNI